jgi:hypothetical protein
MNKKSVRNLSILCAVVLIASAWVLTRPPSSNQAIETFGLDTLVAGEVTTLVRSDVTGSVELIRRDDGWTLDGEPVTPASLTSFLNSLATARATRVANQGRVNDTYGFADGTMPSISITTGDTTITLEVGREGVSTGSVYVARPGAPDVYLLEGTTLGDVARADWKQWVAPPSASTTAPLMKG